MKTIIKKTITISFILSALSFISCAQEKTTLELLQGKFWIVQNPDGNGKGGITYTNKKESHYYKDDLLGSSDFYLSETIEKNFDKTKVGKNKIGKYIIGGNDPNDLKNITVLEIIKISEERLEVRNIEQEFTIVFKVKKK
jgi:hypothetical protein